jgi:hypothetical protein
MLGTLHQMRHHIKTADGVSHRHYGCIRLPLQGVLQGNDASPAIWMLISIPLINMLHIQGFGFQSTNVLSDESYHFTCYTYVDDTDLIHNGTPQSTSQQVFTDMQNMLDHWEGGLRATGGALVPDKSYWYAINFAWNPTKYLWDYKTKAELPGTLIVKNHLQQVEVLKRLEVNEARETLGVFAAVDGNQIAQTVALADKVHIWAEKIMTKQLTEPKPGSLYNKALQNHCVTLSQPLC